MAQQYLSLQIVTYLCWFSHLFAETDYRKQSVNRNQRSRCNYCFKQNTRVRLCCNLQSIQYSSSSRSSSSKNSFSEKWFLGYLALVDISHLELQLLRLMKQFYDVQDSQVRIVVPEKASWQKKQPPVTASVLVRGVDGRRVSDKTVFSIMNLVQNSIENLEKGTYKITT